MSVVTWFEIPAQKLDRAKKFYEHILGVKLTHVEMGPQVMEIFPADHTAPGSGGSIIAAEGYKPSHDGSMVYLHVKNIPATLKKIEAKGGKTLMPKLDIGESGFVAAFQDCEGNRVGLHAMS
jgi:predicted enzyme related to lactoylglutathione lyase